MHIAGVLDMIPVPAAFLPAGAVLLADQLLFLPFIENQPGCSDPCPDPYGFCRVL
jgi:hypothetical protein